MTEQAALLAAVIAAPDDDLPRLVFADWLDETGHPANAARAGFIRTQMAAFHAPADSPEQGLLYHRASQLRESFRDEVDRVLPENWLQFGHLIHRRGFADEVRGTFGVVMPIGASLLTAGPIGCLQLRAADQIDAEEEARRYDWWQHTVELKRIRRLSLSLGGQQRGLFLDSIWDCPHLTQLEELNLAGNSFNDGWAVAFLSEFGRTAFAPSLWHLDLSHNYLTDAAANTFVTIGSLGQIERLVLANNRFSDWGEKILRRRFGDRVVL